MPADASELRDALAQWIQDAGDDAAQSLFEGLDVPRASGELQDSGSVVYQGGTQVSGEWLMEFTAPQGEYTDQPVAEIVGNPWLRFVIDGQVIFVHSVTPSRVHEGWWTDNVTDEAWQSAVGSSLEATAP